MTTPTNGVRLPQTPLMEFVNSTDVLRWTDC